MKPRIPRDGLNPLDHNYLLGLKRNWTFLYGLGIVGTYFLTVLLASHPPFLQDYPTWVYEGVIVSRLLAGHASPHFLLKHYPVPNALTDVAFGLLMNVFSWQWAAKIWVCLYLIFASFACLHLLRGSKSSDHLGYVLMPSVVVGNLCFWYGFINFQWAVAMMVLFCPFMLRDKVGLGRTSLFLALIFLTHAVPFLVCSLALLIYIRFKKSYRLLVAYLPSFLLGVWYLYGRFITENTAESSGLEGSERIAYMSKAFLAYKVNTVLKSVGYVDPEITNIPVLMRLVGPIGFAGVLCAALSLGLLLLYALIMSGRKSFCQQSSTRQIWLTISVVVIIAVLCPIEALGISDPGARFAVCCLALGVSLLQVSGRLRQAIAAASVVVGVVSACLFIVVSADLLPEGSSIQMPRHLAHLAHVSPHARTGSYDALEENDMAYPAFNTALLKSAGKK